MILKKYLKRALETVAGFIQVLAEWLGIHAEFLKLHPDRSIDWMREAWERTAPARPYHPC